MRFLGVVSLLIALAPAQSIELYRAQHRPAAELLPIAESALGGEGQVTLDTRTATLVLNGTPSAVKRALSLLQQLDRPLSTVVLTHDVRDAADLEAFGVAVDWKVSSGPLSVGTLPLPADGVRIALAGRRESSRSHSTSMLRLLEGGTGLITTGEAFPIPYQPYWGTTAVDFVPVESGFEAAVSVLGDGNVRLDLRPFSGRIEGGLLRYTAATTSLTVSPGETVVLGEVSREEERSGSDLTGGARARSSEQRVLLISVAVEN